MNRIYHWADPTPFGAESAWKSDSDCPTPEGSSLHQFCPAQTSKKNPHFVGPFVDSLTDKAEAQAFFTPLHYEEGYAYPLLVWLHGPASSERELNQVLPRISVRNYVGAAPRGSSHPISSSWGPSLQGGGLGFGWRQTERDICLAEQRVFESVAEAENRFHLSPDHIFLAGYGCGGTMAMRIGLRNPHAFAGVLSVGGPLPQGHSPLIRLPAMKGLPLLIAYGRDAEDYPEERVCQDLRLLHSAGASVEVRQYPCKDELTTQMLLDMDVWMMERVTSSNPA